MRRRGADQLTAVQFQVLTDAGSGVRVGGGTRGRTVDNLQGRGLLDADCRLTPAGRTMLDRVRVVGCCSSCSTPLVGRRRVLVPGGKLFNCEPCARAR